MTIETKLFTKKRSRTVEIRSSADKYIPDVTVTQKAMQPARIIWTATDAQPLEWTESFVQMVYTALEVAETWNKELGREVFTGDVMPQLSGCTYGVETNGITGLSFYQNDAVRRCDIFVDGATSYPCWWVSQGQPTKGNSVAPCKVFRGGGAWMTFDETVLFVSRLNFAMGIARKWNGDVGQGQFSADGIHYTEPGKIRVIVKVS